MSRCFVIGPIGDKFAAIGSERREVYESALAVFDDVIKPACAANDITPVRADQIARSGEITEQIFRHLRDDDVVIADLSGANANVMYELGLRHTRDLLTITIGEYGLLPFDLSAIRTIQFSRSERGLIEARKALQQALSLGLAEGADPVTATRVWLSLQPTDEGSQQADGEGEPPEDESEDLDADGFLEQMNAIEEDLPSLVEDLEGIGDAISDLGSRSESLAPDIDVMNSGGGTARDRLNLMGRWARVIQEPADQLTERVSRFSRRMYDLDPSMRGVLQYALTNTDEMSTKDVVGFLESIVGMATASREAMEGFNSVGASAKSLGSVSKVLRRPGRQIGAAVDAMVDAVALIDTWESEASKTLTALRLDDRSAADVPS